MKFEEGSWSCSIHGIWTLTSMNERVDRGESHIYNATGRAMRRQAVWFRKWYVAYFLGYYHKTFEKRKDKNGKCKREKETKGKPWILREHHTEAFELVQWSLYNWWDQSCNQQVLSFPTTRIYLISWFMKNPRRHVSDQVWEACS